MVQRNGNFGFSLLLVGGLLALLPAPQAARAQFAYAAPPAAAWGQAWPSARPAAAPHPAVCRIVAPEKNAVSYGSGTLVDVRGEHGLVVTNWHVVRDATGRIEVHFPDGFQCAAQVLKTDHDWDLAALAIWRPSVEPVRLAATPPRPGDLLTIAGYGSGQYRAATGRCTQYVAPGERHPFEMVEISTEARQGDSGGPIFNTTGELAGVLFGAGKGTTSGSHSSRVSWFLASLAPDLGRPDISQIAAAPRGGESAAPPPSARLFAPAIDPSEPKVESFRSPAPDMLAAAEFGGERERLTPVAPAEIRGSPQREAGPPAMDRVAADFGAPPGIRPLADTPPASRSVPLEARVDLSRPSPGITWEAVAGDTLLAQTKTVLAAIGVLALLFHGLRLAGRSSPKPRRGEPNEPEDDE